MEECTGYVYVQALIISYNEMIKRSLPGSVKKCGLLKILHEKYPTSRGKQRQSQESREFHELIVGAAQGNKDLLPHIGKAQEILNPLRVLYLFKSIADEVTVDIYMLLR